MNYEYEEILKALKDNDGNISAAARDLGTSRQNLRVLMMMLRLEGLAVAGGSISRRNRRNHEQ